MALSQWPDKFRDDWKKNSDHDKGGQLVWAEINGHVTALTELGVCFDKKWIPKSQVSGATLKTDGDIAVDDLKIDDFVTHIEIPVWLAEDKNLAY